MWDCTELPSCTVVTFPWINIPRPQGKFLEIHYFHSHRILLIYEVFTIKRFDFAQCCITLALLHKNVPTSAIHTFSQVAGIKRVTSVCLGGGLPLYATDKKWGPGLVHAETPASVRHFLQLAVLNPQSNPLCFLLPVRRLGPARRIATIYIHPLHHTRTHRHAKKKKHSSESLRCL